MPAWSEIADNYPRGVAKALGALAGRRFDGEQAGRLILWHGVPGTGKTHALRALAWEWRRWCDFHYVTDPEELFGSPKYMLDVLLDEDDDDSGWRLLILEDTGELLALDTRYQTGQGLSRLLNVVDGLIGQGLRVVVLVTTNAPLGTIHPAVSRPGRCAAQVEFTAFPPEEADAWLEHQGRDGDGSARTSRRSSVTATGSSGRTSARSASPSTEHRGRRHGRRPPGLRSVNGKHTPFVRPGCGFESCRRLFHTPVAQRNRAPSCDGGGRWFESSRAYRIHSRT